MNQTKTFLFFDSKSKKQKKPAYQPQSTHSRSLSSKSDLTKNSARNKISSQKPQGLPLTKKQKQIRQAIQHRFKKSKMREYEIEYNDKKARERTSSSRSSQMEQFRNMKQLKVVNLKQFHDQAQKRNLQEKQKNSIKNKLKIRTDSSLIMKTQGSDKSMEKLKFLKSYLQPQTPTKLQSKLKAGPGATLGNKQQWKFISIQVKQKQGRKSKQNKSRSKEIKINSHRTLTIQKNEKIRMKTTQSQWDFVPKLKQLSKLNKKYKF